MFIGISISIVAQLRAAASFVPDFYVDSVSGSDANDGMTEATAFATLAAVETEALALGNDVIIGLAYGSSWREHLSLGSLSGVQVRAYGDDTLALPKMDCADVAANASFTLTGGTTNVYQITWTHEIGADISKRKLRVWEGGTRLKWVASTALCDAEAGTFHVPTGSIANPATVYIHPFGSTVPTSDGKLYEITAREYGLTVGGGYDVRYVHTTRNASHDGSFVGGANGYGLGILSTDGVVHNQWVSIGSVHERCVAYDCEPSTWRGLNATLFVTYNDGSASGANYSTCYAYSPAATTETHAGFYAHTAGGAAALAAVSFTDCFYYGPAAAATAANTTAFSAVNFFAEWPTGRSNSIACFGGADATTNTISNVTALNPARMFNNVPNVVATNLRCHVVDVINGGLVVSSAVELSNSTLSFSSALTSVGARVFDPSTASATVFNDNVVQNAREGMLRASAADAITSDRNVFRNESFSGVWRVGSTNYNTLADWRTATGEDANSVAAAFSAGIITNPANNDFTFTSAIVDEGGRTAGSRLNIARPDWAALTTEWAAGRLGV